MTRKPTRQHVAAIAGAIALPALALGAVIGAAGASTGVPSAAKVTAIAAKVPASVRSAGVLKVAADATYAPDEFVAANGTTVIGMDADLAKAIGQVLGLKVVVTNATFDTIIPALQSGKFDLGMSSFTDTKAREKQVNFVDYFSAGEGYYVKSGSAFTPSGLAALCGHSVAVETGTTEQTDAQTEAKVCKAKHAKTVTILTFQDQNGANLAVSSGRAQVGFADSQVAQYIVAQSHGTFANSGKAFSTAPYGIAVVKSPNLTPAVQAAVVHLIHDGIYLDILKKWGIASGAVTTARMDGATS